MIERVRALITSWTTECKDTSRRRRQRKLEISLDQLRKEGRLKADETLLGIRLIDEQIRKEQPLFTNYLTGARRMGIFKNKEVPVEDIERLEQEFTEGLRYQGWTLPYFGAIDGSQLHGWDSVEVVYDDKKPLKVGVEHIGHDDLLFPFDAIDIQACPLILRRYMMSPMVLENMVKDFGFDANQVQILVGEEKNKGQIVPKNIPIYKLQFKLDKIVYVAWLEADCNKSTDWLKAPAPLFLGRRKKIQTLVDVEQTVIGPNGQPVSVTVPQPQESWQDETESLYFVAINRYSQTEEKAIAEQKGHAHYDLPYQEAATALASLYINGSVRASNIFASLEKGMGSGSIPKKCDFDLEHGVVYNEPIRFWSPPYPDPGLLKGLQFIDVRKQQESGNLAAAVVNRDDSRKTAEELETAKEETNKLGSVQLVLYSNFVGETLNMQWYIVQNLALQGQVSLLQKPTADALGMTVMQNDLLTLEKKFEVLPAGDVDVVQRQERIQKRLMLMPLVQGIPELAIEFLKDLLREILPEDSMRYITVLENSMMVNKEAMIMALAAMLEQAVTDENGQLRPEFAPFAQQLQQVKQMVMQIQQQQQNPNLKQQGHPSANKQQPQIGGTGGSGQQNMMQNNAFSKQMSGNTGI